MTAQGRKLGLFTASRRDSDQLLFQLFYALDPSHGEQHHRIQQFGRSHQPKLQRALLASTCLGRSPQRNRTGARLGDLIHGIHRPPSLATNAGQQVSTP